MKPKSEKVVVKTISLYRSHLKKGGRLMKIRRIHTFSQLVQRLLDEAPDPQSSDARTCAGTGDHGHAADARP